PRTIATLPPETAMLLAPVASGVGSCAPTAPPDASWTRYLPPGGTEPESEVTCHVVPDADAYWIDQLPRSTAAVPRLKSSTKSLPYGALAFPPPAKSWLTTMSVDALRAAGAITNRAASRSVNRLGNRGIGSSNRERRIRIRLS